MITAATIDPTFIQEVEEKAKVLSKELEDTMNELQESLHAVRLSHKSIHNIHV